jgi:hypothetical protein
LKRSVTSEDKNAFSASCGCFPGLRGQLFGARGDADLDLPAPPVGKFAQFMNNSCGAAAPGDGVHEKQIGYGGNRGRGKFHKLAMLTEPRPTVNLRLFELL